MKRFALAICALATILMSFSTVCAQGIMYPHPEVETEITVNEEAEIKNVYDRTWRSITGEVARADMEYGALRYSVYLPESYDSNKEYPILLYLHGGSIGYLRQSDITPWNKDLVAYSELIAKSIEDCIILAPQAPGVPYANNANNGYWSEISPTEVLNDTVVVNNSGSSPYLRGAEKLMAEFFEKGISYKGDVYKIDVSRVYLAGHSQGAVGSFAALKDCPEVFAAAIIGAGKGDPDTADLWKDTPVLILHGKNDPKVTYKAGEVMAEAIKDHPNSKFISLDSDHNIKPDMYTIENFTWMAKHDRDGSNILTVLVISIAVLALIAIFVVFKFVKNKKRGGNKD